MIRKFHETDTMQIMELWLRGNEEAHSFIPKEYWHSNFSMVQEQLMQAEVYVCETDGRIRGFIGITGEYIAGIFTDSASRCLGIGTQLLNYAKQLHSPLSLDVYEKNPRAVAFYLREGFSILERRVDETTGEKEYTMIWERAVPVKTDDTISE